MKSKIENCFLVSNCMSERKWDELNNDCLSQIFARVGLESLVQFIPFVCKSWYRSTFYPQCWINLEFTPAINSKNLVKYAIGRAQRSATSVVFDRNFNVTREDLLCIAEGCPLLKTLILPNLVIFENSLLLSELIVNWKHLEYLQLCEMCHFEKIFESISIHCNNFLGFIYYCTQVDNEQVSAMVKLAPKIKFLRMWWSFLSREDLVVLLKGCAALEILDVSNCYGFEEGDIEIMMLASHIKHFDSTGAKLDLEFEEDDEDYYEFFCY